MHERLPFFWRLAVLVSPGLILEDVLASIEDGGFKKVLVLFDVIRIFL